MTFDERVEALGYLGFTVRQTRFLVTVALHSGFCLRRQFARFADIEYGKNVRRFLDRLVTRGLAHRLAGDVNRGHIYHLSARSIYRAIDQEDNRNRRLAAPALIARKLMLLDFVLAQPADEWAATEADKVALCHARFHVPHAYLPRRIYAAPEMQEAPLARYFVDKLPLYVAGEPPRLHAVYLAAEPGLRAFQRFLSDHRGLLGRLPHWAVTVVTPVHTVDVRPFRQAFEKFVHGTPAPESDVPVDELDWYFTTRRAVELDRLPSLSDALIERFQQARRQFGGLTFERLYQEWLQEGDTALETFATPECAPFLGPGQLLMHALPFSYRQFGSRPGVV
jgi:hypothetical protein